MCVCVSRTEVAGELCLVHSFPLL